MAAGDFDSPPPYHALKEDSKVETKVETTDTEVTIPHSDGDLDVYGVLFELKDNRIGFVQKIILIKLLQVLAIAIILAVFAGEPYAIYRMMRYDYNGRTNLTVVSSLLLLAVLGLIHYCDKVRFTRPYNFMFLLAYPLSIGFFIGVVTWRSGLVEIFVAWTQFTVVLFCMLVYSIVALQSKIEFRTSTGLYIAAGIFIVTYALSIPFIYVDAFGVLYCTLALFALTGYMLYDLQIMMSKPYRLHLSPSEFVKGALIMHIDYRYMIMNLLKKE